MSGRFSGVGCAPDIPFLRTEATGACAVRDSLVLPVNTTMQRARSWWAENGKEEFSGRRRRQWPWVDPAAPSRCGPCWTHTRLTWEGWLRCFYGCSAPWDSSCWETRVKKRRRVLRVNSWRFRLCQIVWDKEWQGGPTSGVSSCQHFPFLMVFQCFHCLFLAKTKQCIQCK